MRFDSHMTPDDAPNVDHLLRVTYPSEFEAHLVTSLRRAGSLVAEHGLWHQGMLIGYVAYSRAQIENVETKRQILALSPFAVHSDHQREGIGHRLLEESLATIEADAIVTLGHTDFFEHVGFRHASEYGLTFSNSRHQNESFMALECWKGALGGLSGHVLYDHRFYET